MKKLILFMIMGITPYSFAIKKTSELTPREAAIAVYGVNKFCCIGEMRSIPQGMIHCLVVDFTLKKMYAPVLAKIYNIEESSVELKWAANVRKELLSYFNCLVDDIWFSSKEFERFKKDNNL